MKELRTGRCIKCGVAFFPLKFIRTVTFIIKWERCSRFGCRFSPERLLFFSLSFFLCLYVLAFVCLMFCCLLSAGCWLWQSSRPNLERPVSPGLDPPCTMYVWTLIIDYSMPVALVDGGEFIWSFWGVLGLLCTLYCSGSVFIVDPWHSVLSVVAW